MPSDGDVWDRMAGESGKAFLAFRAFRDLGPLRSLSGARPIERRWSYRWRWAERAGAWDTQLWRLADEELLGRR